MDVITKFKETVKGLREIADTQTQLRTKKLKGEVTILEDFVTYFESLPTPAPAEDAPEIEEIKTENKYLKRKQTMYDLKISKLEQEVKKWRAMAKGNNEAGE